MDPVWVAFTEGAAGAEPPAQHQPLLEERIAAARAAWPSIDVAPESIARGLGRLMSELDPPAMPSADAAADVCIAVACADADADAVVAFERRFFGGVAAATGHITGDLDEVVQQLRDRLFLAEEGGVAPVVDYAGRGDLRHLVNVAAVRIALNLRRGEDRRRGREAKFAQDAASLAPALRDPELDFVKASYREQFKRAFEETIGALQPRQRNLLRAHLVEQVSIDELGQLYGVHRSTAARWLTASRQAVAAGVRDRLQRALPEAAAELAPMFDLIRSRLDLSITRILAD